MSRTIQGGIRAARNLLRDLEVAVRSGEISPTSATLDALAAAYIADKTHKLSPATVSLYRIAAKRLSQTPLGSMRLDKVTPLTVDQAYAQLRATGLSEFSLSQVHRFFRSTWTQAIKWQLVKANPVVNAQAPQVPRRAVSSPKPENVVRILEEIRQQSPDIAAVLFVGALTGLRRGALCGLQWGDLERGMLRIQRSVVLIDGLLIERPPKMRNEGEVERVVLGEAEQIALAGLLEVVEQRRADVKLGPVLPGHWMLSDDGLGTSPVDPAMLNRRMALACKTLGIERIGPHALRHFAATQMVAAGIPIDTVARRLHHKNPMLTLTTYAHPSDDDERKAGEAIARSLE